MVGYSNKAYKKKDEEDVRQFLSEKLNRPIGNGPLQPLLSDGILLCDLMQHISPNIRVTRNENKSTFAYHDNIGQFLVCAEKLSIPQAELFQTVDLVEGKSMQSVFSCILAIKRKVAETKTSPPLSAKSVSKQTVNHNSESKLHKQQQKSFPTLLQQKETKKEHFSKVCLKNSGIGKSAVATAILDGAFANGHIKSNSFEYASSTKTKQSTSSSMITENISKYKSSQRQERPNKLAISNGGVRSKIEMYNQPSPVEIMPRRASTQLYLSKSSETADERVKSEEPKTTGPFLKVTDGSTLSEKPLSKRENVQSLKKSGSSYMVLSVETVIPKSSKSTPLVTETAENNTSSHKINQAACRKASLKQMGTNSVVVKDGHNQETVYALGRSIGKGQFGEVFGGLNMSTSEYVAIKRIRRNDMDCDDMNEVDFLKILDSEHIVRYKGYSKDKEFLNIVLEYVEMGSLRTNIKCFGKFPENLAASHTYKILSGLKYLHDKSVIHCDLKAANILITKTGCLKLTDFGVSLFSKMKDDDTGEPSGTPNWMAPEVIKFNRPTEKSDIWSLGCTIVEMLTGKPPYSNMMSFAVLFKIVEDDTLPIPENISEDAHDFLMHCFQKDPKKRPTAADLMQHKWLRHAVTSTSVNKPQRYDNMLPIPKKSSTKEFKKDIINNTTSKTPLSDEELLYPKRFYSREKMHKFYSTSIDKSVKVERCYGCLKTINEGEAKCCKECCYICHSVCALKVTKCSKLYEHIDKNEPVMPFKNSSYSDPRILAFKRKDTPLKSIYQTNTESGRYMHKKMNGVFQ